MWTLIFLAGLAFVIIFSLYGNYLKFRTYLKIARVTSKISGYFTKKAYRIIGMNKPKS